jgi:hypothetical protein
LAQTDPSFIHPNTHIYIYDKKGPVGGVGLGPKCVSRFACITYSCPVAMKSIIICCCSGYRPHPRCWDVGCVGCELPPLVLVRGDNNLRDFFFSSGIGEWGLRVPMLCPMDVPVYEKENPDPASDRPWPFAAVVAFQVNTIVSKSNGGAPGDHDHICRGGKPLLHARCMHAWDAILIYLQSMSSQTNPPAAAAGRSVM